MHLSIKKIVLKRNINIENYTVGTMLQPPIVALEYVTHLAVIIGWAVRYHNNWEGEGDRDMGATCA